MFEETLEDTCESPLIKGGLIHKLIERLTYHTYADPKFMRTFLTTYRSFCDPLDLMNLLQERFEIPDPRTSLQNKDSQVMELAVLDQMKKFRREFCKPIQIR